MNAKLFQLLQLNNIKLTSHDISVNRYKIMKKIIFLLTCVVFVSLSVFSQKKDSIYLKIGEVIPVEQIILNKNVDSLSYHPLGETTIIRKISLKDVSKIYSRYDDVNYLREYNNYNLKINEDYKFNYIRSNLNAFYKEKMKGYCFIASGVALSCAGYIISSSTYNSNPEYYANIKSNNRTEDINGVDIGNVVMIVGGISSLIGIIINIDSYSWIKKASISPTVNGISIKANF